MQSDRSAAIAAAIGQQADTDHSPIGIGHVCRACAQVVGVDGVSFCTAGDLGLAEPIYATDPVSERAVELEITLGLGPGMEALDTGEPVLANDLTRHGRDQWPVLVPLLAALGVRAAFAIPLATGAVTAGVLELYRVRPRPWSAEEVTDGCLFADYALALLINAADQSLGHGVDGVLAGSLAEQWARVYQAVGVVSVQLETGLTPAYQRLRAHAFVTARPLREVADAVLDGQVRFTW